MKKITSLLLVLVMMFGIVTSVDLSVYAEEISTDDLSEQMDYSIFELEYLMNTLYIDGIQSNGSKDLYEAVRTEDFFHREIYDIYSSDPVFEAVTVFKVQTLNDDVNLVTNPQHFYSAVLMDILQNEALKDFNDDSLQSDVTVHTTKALEKAYSQLSRDTIDSLVISNLEEMMYIPWDDYSDDLKKFYMETLNETYLNYDDALNNLELAGKLVEAGDTLLDCMNKLTSLYTVADYNKNTVKILDDMYTNTSNIYLRMAINDIRDLYADLSSPDKLQSVFANGVYGQTFDYSIEKIGYFVIKTTVEVFFADVLAVPLLAWEIGTSIAEALFAITDSATCYMTLEAATLIEDELRVIMQQYRTAYENNKTPENAQKCREAYRLTLANIYYAANTIQDLGYAIAGNGSLWGAIKTLFGSNDYDSFVTICDSTRSIVTTRYYKYSELAKRLYSELYKVNFEEKGYVEIPLRDFTFNEDEVTLKVGDVYTIYTNHIPSNANNVDVFPEYESSNPSVATVNILGAVTAIAPGTTMITVTKNGILKQMTVKVIDLTDEKEYISDENFIYLITGSDTCSVYKYIGSSTNVSIPSVANDYNVTGILSLGYTEGENIKYLTIPSSIKHIGSAFVNNSFYGVTYDGSLSDWCSIEMESTLSNPITVIASNAPGGGVIFIGGNRIEGTVTIPNDVTDIGDYTFACFDDITNVIIPEGVNSIGKYTFYGCHRIESVTLPKSLTSIGSNAFKEHIFSFNNFSNVYYNGTIADWCTISFEDNFSNPMYVADNLYIDNTLISGNLIIPNRVTCIGDYVFWNSDSITSVVIPSSVNRVGNYAFGGCDGLIDICFPNSVKYIGIGALSGCSSLKEAVISDSIISLNKDLFYACDKLESVIIPERVIVVESRVFYGCSSLVNVTIPDGVTSIGDYAFYNCSGITDLTMPISTKIYNSSNTFYQCNSIKKVILTRGDGSVQNYSSEYDEIDTYYRYTPWYVSSCSEIVIENGVAGIGDRSFYDCNSLTSIIIPGSVRNIGVRAFSSCGDLTKIIIPDNVINIDDYAFYYCANLKEIVLPNGIKTIGENAFSECNKIENVYYKGSKDDWNSISFSSGNYSLINATIHYNYDETVVENGTCGENLFWTFNSKTGELLISGTGEMNNFTSFDMVPWGKFRSFIKSVRITENVVSIGDYAFYGLSNLTDIEIPSTVTCIGCFAFYDCDSVINILISNNVNHIGEKAFCECDNLIDITVESQNQIYSSDSFGVLYNKNKTELIQYPIGNRSNSFVIPDTVTLICEHAFSNCRSLENLTIPKSVSQISYGAFSNCKNIVNVYYGGNRDNWNEIIMDNNECLLNSMIYYDWKYGVCGDDLSWVFYELENKLVISGSGQMYNYRYSSDVPWYSYMTLIESVLIDDVTTIGNFAFYNCVNLTSIELPDSITRIGNSAFYNCDSLTNIELPDGITSIGNSAFYSCSSLVNINIPNNVTGIGEDAFAWCSKLESINIPDGVTSIGGYAFYNCDSITSINIPNSVTSIGNAVFKNCDNLTTISISDRITYISNDMFAYCKNLSNVEIPSSVISIGDDAFRSCDSLTAITLNNSVTSIGNNSFYDCSKLTGLILPTGLLSIGESAFYDCVRLHEIIIPASVTNIGESAFANCSFVTIIVDVTNQYYSSDSYGVLYNKNQTELIQYPVGNSRNSFIIPDTVTRICNYAFSHCISLENITIPNGVRSIGEGAFRSCEKLVSVVIPDGITTIETETFSWCENLEDIIIPDSVRNIESYAFHFCKRLKTVVIPYGVTAIEYYSFADCESLTNITIPNSVTYIGGYAFIGCYSLENITIPNSVKNIGFGAFQSCSNLNSVIISDGIETIDGSAFNYCNNITDVFFLGTEEHWSSLAIDFQDDVTIHFNAVECDWMGHYSVVGGQINVAPTCTSSGVMTCTCERCGEIFTETISAIGHSTSEYAVSVEPTCTTAGEKQAECSVCGEMFTETISAFGHAYEAIETIQPTCTQSGYTKYSCTRCNSEKNSDYISALGHTPDGIGTIVEPSCTEQGYTEYVCSVCETVYRDDYISPLGHNFINDVCTNCSKVINHLVLGDNAKVTVIIPGEVAYFSFIPEVSGTYYFFSDAQSDTYGYVYDENFNQLVSDDDSGDGNTFLVSYDFVAGEQYYLGARYYSSSNTGEFYVVLSDKYTSSHQYVVLNNVAPTCTDQGYTEYECSLCGNSHYDNYVDAIGHTFETVITIAPTCTQQGYTESYCSVCENTYHDDYVNALGHNFVNDVCTNCSTGINHLGLGDNAKVTVTIPGEILYYSFVPEISGTYYFFSDAQNDTYGYVYDENFNQLVSDDDSGDGNTFLVSYDFVAGEQYYLGARYYSSSNTGEFYVVLSDTYTSSHQYIVVNNVAPTCTDQGYTEYECSLCGNSYYDNYVDAIGHTFETVNTIAPTCTQQGYTESYCSVCENTYRDDYIDALGHNLTDWVITLEPTETTQGRKEQSCLRCGTRFEEIIPVLGGPLVDVQFSLNLVEETDSTVSISVNIDYPGGLVSAIDLQMHTSDTIGNCIEITGGHASIETKYFSEVCMDGFRAGCIAVFKFNKLSSKLITAEDFTLSVETLISKDFDDLSYIIISNLHSHEYVSLDIKEPTCTEGGYTYYECTGCKDTYKDNYTSALGHNFVDGQCASCLLKEPDDSIKFILNLISESDTEVVVSINLEDPNELVSVVELQMIASDAIGKCISITQGNLNYYSFFSNVDNKMISACNLDGFSSGTFALFTFYKTSNTVVTNDDFSLSVSVAGNLDGNNLSFGVVNNIHQYVKINTIDPTCSERGYTEYRCSVCQKTCFADYVDTIEHTFETVNTIVPTCTQQGYTEYCCAVCGEFYTEYTEATGHIASDDITVVAPTCTQDGYTEYTCENCEEVIRENYTNRLGHNFIENTCINCNMFIKTLTVCESSKVEITEPGMLVYFEFVPDTSGNYCFFSDAQQDTYGYIYDESFNQLASDDDSGDGNTFLLSYDFVAGVKYYLGARYYSSSETGEFYVVLSDSYVSSHNYIATEVVEPNCYEEGYTVYTCSYCGDSYMDDYTEIHHALSSILNVVEPVCGEREGYTVYYCSECNEEYYDDWVWIDHIAGDKIEVVEPVCGKVEGYTVYNCSSCGENFYSDWVWLEHNKNQVMKVVEPVCGEEYGYTKYRCSCGTMFNDDYIWKDHTGEFVETTEGTCTQASYNVYKCTDCGEEYNEWNSDQLGHSIEDGMCTRCDMVITEIQLNVLTDVNIETEGDIAYFIFIPEVDGIYYFYSDSDSDTYGYLYDLEMNLLSSCDDYEDNNFVVEYELIAGQKYYIAASYYSSNCIGSFRIKASDEFTSNHCYELIETIQATCHSEGYKRYKCSVCEQEHWDNYVDPTGHNYVDGLCDNCGCHENNHLLDVKPAEDTAIVIDDKNKIIYGISSGLDRYEFRESYLSVCDDVYVKTNTEVVGTGTIVSFECDGETLEQYTVLVFGDVNGDGWYDGTDAVLVSCLANGMLTKDDVSEAVYMAADCNHDGVIDQLDVDLLNEAGALLANVDQTKPAEVLLETSSEYVEYISLIDQSPEIGVEVNTETDIEPNVPESEEDGTCEEDTEELTQQDAKVDIFEMIMNFIKSIFEMLLAYIPVSIK